MEFIPVLLKEMEKENVTTREMLSRIPDTIYDWQPHPKSMTVRSLATHLAELPSWVDMVLNTDGLDFATMPYNPPVVNHTADILNIYDKSYEAGHSALAKADPAILEKTWTLSNGDKVLAADNKLETLRMVYCQIVHHRAQMGVFLRLNNVPIPPSYGPSADEGSL
ncbi:DinB family protein [Arachidicoccus terrestris]|uniref:DinB family protein n=1 Tax=Arachidicoccus terrestris TaxID=2875539 RepID=UPI001CC7DC42|nr:DinB family protein [Arachidicoccus terrestris]UAY54598.1 DinB family protein [Arachidicoccus terrestris]